jgi:antirestriction protein ArdC
MTFDIYQEVTDRIVAMLEKGVVPWRCPILGRQKAGFPKNLASGKEYRGVNVFLLAMTGWAEGYESAYWLTFNQAKDRGGSVRKGERSSMVVFWKQYEVDDRDTGEPKNVPVLRYYNVFNVQQCDGVPYPDAPKFEPIEFSPVAASEGIVAGYADGPTIEHGGASAYYTPKTDAVKIPEATRFASVPEFYATLFHELAHSTGHSKRLDRGLDKNPAAFGSSDYGKEELVAEMASAFLCAQADIQPVTIENQAAYIQGWLERLRGDKRLVVTAAGAAQKAADWIRGNRKPIE